MKNRVRRQRQAFFQVNARQQFNDASTGRLIDGLISIQLNPPRYKLPLFKVYATALAGSSLARVSLESANFSPPTLVRSIPDEKSRQTMSNFCFLSDHATLEFAAWTLPLRVSSNSQVANSSF